MDKTLLKGLMVLEAISKLDEQPRSLDQIAEIVGLTRSNTHRTLQTLAHAGYVVKEPDPGGYRCTFKMFELGAQQIAGLDVRKLAAPIMRQLAEATSETVHLSVLEGADVIYIDKLDSPKPIRAYSAIGGRAPAYAVATGKALLAFESPDYLNRFPEQLEQHTAITLPSLKALKVELAKISRQGFAVNRGEWRDGVGGIAAPVFNGLDKPIAALGISGPLEGLSVAAMRKFAPIVLRAAQDLSKSLGYRGTRYS
jgi:DNA-binding IclR family transcriptional regulator